MFMERRASVRFEGRSSCGTAAGRFSRSSMLAAGPFLGRVQSVNLFALILSLLITSIPLLAESVTFTTLNCYWFFQDGSRLGEAPKNEREYDQKAGHLVGLLPREAPLFVGFQEIGTAQDLQRLAHAASQRYGRRYQPLFVQGRDTATKQDVGAILDTSRGWGVHGRASRVSDLEKELSKHLVVRLTNALTLVDACVVHLRVPRDAGGILAQKNQNGAILRWSMRHLSKNAKANLVILGDFNEGHPVGSKEQNLAVLFSARPPLVDAFDQFMGKPVTHAGGKALDRILISDGLFRGTSGLRFSGVEIHKHSRGKGENRRLYTDHFPVSIRLSLR